MARFASWTTPPSRAPLLAAALIFLLLAIAQHTSASPVRSTPQSECTTAACAQLHHMHQRSGTLWHHVATPLVLGFLSAMGFSAFCAGVLLLGPQIVRGAVIAARPTIENATSTTLSTLVVAPSVSSGLNESDKSGPTCYTPSCEYEPVSGACKHTMMDLVYVAVIVWVLCWVLPGWRRAHVAAAARARGTPRQKADETRRSAQLARVAEDGESLLKYENDEKLGDQVEVDERGVRMVPSRLDTLDEA